MSLALVSACASYNYPVYDAGDGVYYASSPPTYTFVDPYPGFSYYSPYFYPYYFSVWYSPWYRHHYGWYSPPHHRCPPYRMPHAAHYAGVSPDPGQLPDTMNPGPTGPYPNPPGVYPGPRVNNPELWQAMDNRSLWRESMYRGANPGQRQPSAPSYRSMPVAPATSTYSRPRSGGIVLPSNPRSSITGSSRSARSTSATRSRGISTRSPALHDQ